MSWQRGQRASASFFRLARAASCIETVEQIDKLCLQSVAKDNTLLMSQPNIIPNTWTYTHTQFWSSSSDSATGTVGGGPSVLVVLISSHVKTHLKEYRRFAWSIASMRLPPIWESGSVWTLWMSEDKMKAYMHHEDIVDVSRFMYTMYQYQYNMKLFFFNRCDHLSNVSKWHQHTSTVSRVSRLENYQ